MGKYLNRLGKLTIYYKDTQYNGKKKGQNIKQWFINTTQKTKEWATGIPLWTGGELRWCGRGSSSYSTISFYHCIVCPCNI
jgi:hypothetical protein